MWKIILEYLESNVVKDRGLDVENAKDQKIFQKMEKECENKASPEFQEQLCTDGDKSNVTRDEFTLTKIPTTKKEKTKLTGRFGTQTQEFGSD